MASVKVSSNATRYGQDVAIRQFQLTADEPVSAGGDDAGPAPFEWVLAGLGSCTAMTVKMYADRKGWDLQQVSVNLSHKVENHQHLIQIDLALSGHLDDRQRQRLREISDRCPVHQLLTASATIQTRLMETAQAA
ncbi:osmotically inducible protein OsmC [filamentous cyanobacterium CCP5]|nr:osmotically inducible protein OsmC [filamentous cyanobacterium CCP5]